MSTVLTNFSDARGKNVIPALGRESQASSERKRPGALVISLDFELHWGVRDSAPLDGKERARLLSARRIVPRMLDLFEEYSIHATWATVGLLFAQSRTEAEAFMPTRRPKYRDSRLDPYQETLGAGEADDPFHFAPSLIAEIASRPGQEIACHSFSHYYAMEPGQASEEFEADLMSAVAMAAQSGHSLRSYVFPRNEVNPEYLSILKRLGIQAYRGTEPTKIKEARSFDKQQRPHRRLGRLLDSYVDLCGHQTGPWPQEGELISVPASRYLRPYSPVLQSFEVRRHARIEQAMKYAAEHGEVFHLWWHPEDFSYHCDENLVFLRSVLMTFDRYRAEYGMVSLGMAEINSPAHRTQPMCNSEQEQYELA
jgi:peptidoglycan/xylan/chitin deacetylase (PgdA/CDA1 family)